MAKLGQYTYPDIRFGDAVEIAGRILTKFKGTVSVKGLAWELGMAEGSGTLFAKVAAMRDFGLIEGRGELRISALAQRVIHPSAPDEGQEARAEAFQRVELLRQLYHKFEGEVPDDMSMLVGLEEITRASRDEIVRRSPLILKHLTDAIRVLGRPVQNYASEYSEMSKNKSANTTADDNLLPVSDLKSLQVAAGGRNLSLPLQAEYIDVAIGMLSALKQELQREGRSVLTISDQPFDYQYQDNLYSEGTGFEERDLSELEFGSIDQLDVSEEQQG